MKGNEQRTRIYDQVTNAHVKSNLLRQQGTQEGANFATCEAEWLIYASDALGSFIRFLQEFEQDQDIKNLERYAVQPVREYLLHRMMAPGNRRKFMKLRDQFSRDGLRHSLVQDIRSIGYKLTEACEKAAQYLAEINHPLGFNEDGEELDSSTILKSVTRWERSGLPDELWELPGMTKYPPIPDPKSHFAKE